ncbi:hypothetical protein AVEN_217425-1 [Araneus ventricosus]|uniref:Uncharacterized protein n=1 Tax=Araneus ventricosus TaxID=182803 RepID=A0A4Y2VYK9_ARAVE|nr:hypothetical protein AVEN_217425-1 [Araneus ventricosus]
MFSDRSAENLAHECRNKFPRSELLVQWEVDLRPRWRRPWKGMVKAFEKALKEGKKMDSEDSFQEDPTKHEYPMQVGGWISDQMRKTLERMVEGFEKALEEGKKISEDSFRKAEEMYHKLLDWGIDVGEKVKEALERIGKDFEDNRLVEIWNGRKIEKKE